MVSAWLRLAHKQHSLKEEIKKSGVTERAESRLQHRVVHTSGGRGRGFPARPVLDRDPKALELC